MEKLPEITEPKGTGISGLTSTLVKRNGNLCMYKRSDNVYEVFFVQNMNESIFHGKTYPAHELYPGNESFGNTAWCFSNKQNAEVCYKSKLLSNKD